MPPHPETSSGLLWAMLTTQRHICQQQSSVTISYSLEFSFPIYLTVRDFLPKSNVDHHGWYFEIVLSFSRNASATLRDFIKTDASWFFLSALYVQFVLPTMVI